MDRETFRKCKEHLLRKASQIMTAKEAEYFSEDDVLSNLKRIAMFRSQETPKTIMNLMAKQLVSLSDMIDHESDNLDPYPVEVWDSKFCDVINYIFKLYASIRESR